MKTFDVTIQATVKKTIRVEVEDHEGEQEATEAAHGQFSVANTDEDEKYDEETLQCVEVKP